MANIKTSKSFTEEQKEVAAKHQARHHSSHIDAREHNLIQRALDLNNAFLIEKKRRAMSVVVEIEFSRRKSYIHEDAFFPVRSKKNNTLQYRRRTSKF